MAKVEFDPGIESVRGILMGTDPFYIRRYPQRGGGVMHIVQARPDATSISSNANTAANSSSPSKASPHQSTGSPCIDHLWAISIARMVCSPCIDHLWAISIARMVIFNFQFSICLTSNPSSGTEVSNRSLTGEAGLTV